MIWLLLYTLIFGAPEHKTSLFDEKSKKYIKQYLTVEGNRNEALSIIDDYEKRSKEFEKKKKKVWQRNFKVLISDRETDSEELKRFFVEFLDFHKSIDEFTYLSGAKIRPLINEDEWDDIVTAIAENYESKEEKRQKTLDKNLKLASKNASKICSIIDDPDKRTKAKEVIQDFFSQVSIYQRSINEINYRDSQTLRDKYANENDLNAVQQYIRKQQMLLFDIYIISYGELKSLSTEREFDRVVKILEVPI